MELTAILLIGHGSRATEANEAMYQVAAELKATQKYPIVECAFLEINQPDISAGLSNCQVAGAVRIVVVPYFLHLGNHVQQDLPGIIGAWQTANPGIEIVMGRHFGYSPKLVELVEERIKEVL